MFADSFYNYQLDVLIWKGKLEENAEHYRVTAQSSVVMQLLWKIKTTKDVCTKDMYTHAVLQCC